MWQRLGCCCQTSQFYWSSVCASAIVEQLRWAIACDMYWIVTCCRSLFKHMHWFIRLTVSLVMMALAFGVPKLPCSSPAQKVTSGKLALTFHAFLNARNHKIQAYRLYLNPSSQLPQSTWKSRLWQPAPPSESTEGGTCACLTAWLCRAFSSWHSHVQKSSHQWLWDGPPGTWLGPTASPS